MAVTPFTLSSIPAIIEWTGSIFLPAAGKGPAGKDKGTDPMKELFQKVKQSYYRVASVPRCLGATALLQAVAYIVSSILIGHTGAENNSALVYMLAISLTALLTDGYFYGILSSLIGGFSINYFFMFPYTAFSLSYAGYPVAMLSMVFISCVVSALTTRVKQQAIEAARREQNTKLLYEMNTRLYVE